LLNLDKNVVLSSIYVNYNLTANIPRPTTIGGIIEDSIYYVNGKCQRNKM